MRARLVLAVLFLVGGALQILRYGTWLLYAGFQLLIGIALVAVGCWVLGTVRLPSGTR